jgi:hypothetical protein
MTRPGELNSVWKAAGFADIRETMLTIRMDFTSFEDYRAPYTGKDGPIAAFVRTLSPSEQSRLQNMVRKAYLDGEADGPRSYAATAWAVFGVVPV